LIQKYYTKGSLSYEILVVHSEVVTTKALAFADGVAYLQPDVRFVREAAMLHDIGIFLTDARKIGCTGAAPYIMHGPLGRELLEKEGLPRHALVCDRHTGVGISKSEIVEKKLSLPERDMLPVTLEEKIICFADCFYGKDPRNLTKEKSIVEVEKSIARFGAEHLERLNGLRKLFNV